MNGAGYIMEQGFRLTPRKTNMIKCSEINDTYCELVPS